MYAGDEAKKSIDRGLKEADVFMRDSDDNTKYEDVQNASVKWNLAKDAENESLYNSARNEMIGHLSSENKGEYLKNAQPLQKYIEAKDEFDYKHNNYTTTKNVDTTPNEDVRNLQIMLNDKGYGDKFGNALKVDGVYAGKTAYANNSYHATNLIGNTKNVNVEQLSKKDVNILPGTNIYDMRNNKVGSTITDDINENNKKIENALTNGDPNVYRGGEGINKWINLPDVSERIPAEYEMYKNNQISEELYNAFDSLSRRWFYADTVNARKQISEIAQSVRNNNYKIENCEKSANDELRNNANEIKGKNSLVSAGNSWFKGVAPGGSWDYKANTKDWFPKEGYFLYYGEIITPEDFGNINFGYTGTVLGLTPKTLYIGGGEVAPSPTQYESDHYYKDSEADHYWIEKGIKQANNAGYYGTTSFPEWQIRGMIKAGRFILN